MSTTPPPDAARLAVKDSTVAALDGLPLPRLILRVGGLGNRRFGTENGIAEDPAALKSAAGEACKQVFCVIAETLEEILAEDQSLATLYPSIDDENPSWWRSWIAGWIFGKADRWDRQRLAGLPASVFSPEFPLVEILTGGLTEGEAIILEAIKGHSTQVEFEHCPVLLQDPAQVSGRGLGIGRIPEPWHDTPGTSPLSREQAGERARILAERVYGFRAQSEALRHQSDILLAVWDPDTEARAGGTSESVSIALQEGIPVIAVRLRGVEAPKISMLSSSEDLGDDDATPLDWQSDLRAVISYLLKFPTSPEADYSHGKQTAYHPRVVFSAFRENRPLMNIWPSRLWRGFDRMVKGHARIRTGPRTADDRLDFVAVFWGLMGLSLPMSPMPFPAEVTEKGSFNYHYGRVKRRADEEGMSAAYGDAQRGGILASYLLSVLAVFFAAAGIAIYLFHLPVGFSVAAAILELLAIALMYSLCVASRSENWLEAYLDSAFLAEALRIMEPVGLFGVHTPLPRWAFPKPRAAPAPQPIWSLWYFRALVRMAPLRLRTDDINLLVARDRLLMWIDAHIQHHDNNVGKLRFMREAIHRLTNFLFGLMALCVAVHLFDAVLVHSHHPLLVAAALFICLGGPVVIAALHEVAFQLQIESRRQKSSVTIDLLRDRRRALVSLALTPHAADVRSIWDCTSEALKIASILMDEVANRSRFQTDGEIHLG